MALFVANLCAVLEKHETLRLSTVEWAKMFLEEEIMNSCLLFMMLMCGYQVRFFFNLIFLNWTILQASELGDSVL